MRKKTSTPRALQRQVRIQLVLTNNDQMRTSNLEASLPWSGAKNSSVVAHRTMAIANPTAACFQREWSSTRPSRLTPERWKRELIEKVWDTPEKRDIWTRISWNPLRRSWGTKTGRTPN
jgi:hypothetical protein